MSNFNKLFRDACDEYIDSCKSSSVQPPCDEVAMEILSLMYTKVSIENNILDKNCRLRAPHSLPPFIVARIIWRFHHATLINRTTTSQSDRDGKRGLYLAAYEDDVTSARFGLYSSEKIETLARAYNPGLSSHDIKEVHDHLYSLCKNDIRELTRDKNLVAVHNGIFNIETKQLMDFSSDYIFMTKSRIDYNPNATTSPKISNPDGTIWDVETWIKEIANHEPELEQLLWEVIAATLRSSYSFDKAALFYSPQGSNGKGTFAELLKSMIPYADINLGGLSARFGLSALRSPVALIISDENSTEFMINDSTAFKCLVTHDPISVECKYCDPIELTFEGLVVQCINKLPKISDISNSLIRRLMIVPFKQLYQGKENRNIKSDYVHRIPVLEYVLHKALDMNFDAFHVPAQCELLLHDFMEENNSVYAFFSEIESRLQWMLVPNVFIYQLYVKWVEQNMPSEKPLGRNTFLHELRDILGRFPDWEYVKNGMPTKGYTFGFEPLIEEYELYADWGVPGYSYTDTVKACTPPADKIPDSTGGIRRKTVNSNLSMPTNSDEDTDTSCDSMDEES